MTSLRSPLATVLAGILFAGTGAPLAAQTRPGSPVGTFTSQLVKKLAKWRGR